MPYFCTLLSVFETLENIKSRYVSSLGAIAECNRKGVKGLWRILTVKI
jgi:hypothetical protein